MKLWFFGDSYAADHNQDSQWQHILKDYYNCEAVFDAANGYSNERILKGVDSALCNISPQDWVIVITTDSIRRWFFENLPQYSNYYNLSSVVPDLSKSQLTALEQYTRHLQNTTVDNFNYVCQIEWLRNIPHRNLIHLQGFYNTDVVCAGCAQVQGTLTESVSELEFVNNRQRELWYARSDTRLNHLSWRNHIILADLIRSVIDGETTTIDLTQGFESTFLTV